MNCSGCGNPVKASEAVHRYPGWPNRWNTQTSIPFHDTCAANCNGSSIGGHEPPPGPRAGRNNRPNPGGPDLAGRAGRAGDTLTVLSAFSGIGGLDLGLERAGMTIAGQIEIDPWCRSILAKHWPEVPRHDDVRTSPAWWGTRTADLVCGGFPCQPVSLAGKGLAQADSRWLWPAFYELICHVRPRYVLLENVPGLLGRGMGDVLGDLAAGGYDAEWDRIPAAFVGAPHIRERIWIVAYPGSTGLRHEPGRRNGQDRPGAAEPGNNGQARAMAHTEGERGELWTTAPQRPRGSASGGNSPSVAHAEGERPQERESQPGNHEQKLQAAKRGSDRPERTDSGSIGCGNQPRVFSWQRPQELGWWRIEPPVGRVANGIPRRVDRLRGLGNAVVPQVAEHVGRMITEHALATG